MLKSKLLFASILAATVIFSCKKESSKTYDCTGLTPTYTTDIKPIFDAKCASSGCHDAVTKEKGYNLSTYAGSKAGGSDAILGSIQHLSGYDAMPEGGSKLDEASIQKIYCWIENGKPE